MNKKIEKGRGQQEERQKKVEKLNKYSLLLQVLGSILLYLVIECISRHSFVEAFSFMVKKPLVFLYNAFLIFVTSCVVYLFKHRAFARILWFIIWLGFGIANGILLSFRVTPFTGPDLHLIGDATKIVKVYMTLPMILGAIVGVVILLLFIGFIWWKAPVYQGKVRYVKVIPFVMVMFLSLYGVTHIALQTRVLSSYFGNIASAYKEYGFPYCLTTTLFRTGISHPSSYSEAAINRITRNFEEDQTLDGKKSPNIIFLQLESFFDPMQVEYLELSEDPIPNFRAFVGQYSSGYLRVPAVGAGTANTEFEVITGMNLRYFGPGEYPYKTVLKKNTCESMAYDMKELGYKAHAIHNNEANFYDRMHVFSQLGFDTFTSKEYMDIKETTETGWAKDRVLIGSIMDTLTSTKEKDYIYTISVQGHGDYPEEPILENPRIRVGGVEEEGKKYAWEYYVNQIHEMDQFVKDLTDTLEAFDEDTILVMYGDHLPTMGLKTEDLRNRYLFQTQYIIWNNMGLEAVNENIASYQLSAMVLGQLDIHKGTIFEYHQKRRGTKGYQTDLEKLQYDLLYGKKYAYHMEDPFVPTNIVMGVKEIKIKDITPTKEGSFLVTGENFTPFSQVECNGTIKKVKYEDEEHLLLEEVELEKGDILTIVQVAQESGAPVLSRSKEYHYE